MLAEMPRNGTDVGVVASAGRGADDETDCFPFIKLIGAGSRQSGAENQESGNDNYRKQGFLFMTFFSFQLDFRPVISQ